MTAARPVGRSKRRPGNTSASSYQQVYAAVCRIPRGRVATYGQIAELAGLPGQARQVGYALHALPAGSGVPWQRVINARGEISLDGSVADLQRALLESEDVRFAASRRIDLKEFGWRPRSATSSKPRSGASKIDEPGSRPEASARRKARKR